MKIILKKVLGRYLNFINKTNVCYEHISLKTIFGIGSKVSRYTKIDINTIVGMHTYIGYNCTITKTIIGNYCGIGDNVVIGPGEHNMKNISINLYNDNMENDLTKKDCIVGNDVWIGTGAVILRGVHVGNGAVIGANSIVTKDIPAYAIAVGSPAKVIRFRFDTDIISEIEDSLWFNKNKESALKTIEKIQTKCL